MNRLWINRWTLAGLYALAMGRAFLRLRDPRRRAAGRNLDEFHRRVWRQAAEALGGQCTVLSPDVMQITLNGACTRVFENVSAIDDPVTLRILHDKVLTHKILQAQNLPMPAYAAFTLRDMRPALAFLHAEARDCVVKPAGGTGGGRGVSTGIRSVYDLARAAAAASVYSDELLIEEQLAGDNYRLLYLDGRLIDAFIRRPPAVVADGRSSIVQLLHQANDQRLRHGSDMSQVLIAIDLDMRRTLARQGLSLRSVPAAGMPIQLKTIINENCGVDNTTVTSLLCHSIVRDGQRAVRALGARFVGLDLITRDPSVPLAESGGAIIEANGTPNLYYHYHKSDSVFPLAEHLLRRILVQSLDGISGKALVPQASSV